MLCIYLIPMILRPIDFLSNLGGYICGLFTYILLIPMYINVFSIYAFCNLHDVSWGNRPTTQGTGTEAFSADKQIQLMTEHNYQEFRANILFIWIVANGAYFWFVLGLAGSDSPTEINNGSVGALQVFTMFLASLVIYKVIFATIYVCKWKCRYNCKKEYKVKRYNLEKNFRKMRAKQDDEEGEGNSSDDDAIFEIAKKIYLAECKKRGEVPFTGSQAVDEHDEEDSTLTEKDQIKLVMERRHSQRMSIKNKDDDYDGAELDDADEEELEDKIVEMQF